MDEWTPCKLKGWSNLLFEANFEFFLCCFFAGAFCLCYFFRFFSTMAFIRCEQLWKILQLQHLLTAMNKCKQLSPAVNSNQQRLLTIFKSVSLLIREILKKT